MPQKHRYTAEEHRQVEHIKKSEERAGHPADEAEGIAYATVNKLHPDAHRYTAKEKRQAAHIAESEEHAGKSPGEAKRIAYATVNKHTR
ncbi:MAG TPA: hypothetical protein VIG46_07670 [Candidatus Baltobacteraceae bacterium]